MERVGRYQWDGGISNQTTDCLGALIAHKGLIGFVFSDLHI